MSAIDVKVVETEQGVQFVVDPAQAKTAAENFLKIAIGIAQLTGQTALVAALTAVEGFATQDWFIQIIVDLLAIPDHLRPKAAEALVKAVQEGAAK